MHDVAKHTFLSVPQIAFGTSVKLDPRQQIERHGLDVSFGAGDVSLDMEIMQHILDILKEHQKTINKETVHPSPTPSASPPTVASLQSAVSPQSATNLQGILSPQSADFPTAVSSATLSPRSSIMWASPLSPTSPLMEVLSVSSAK